MAGSASGSGAFVVQYVQRLYSSEECADCCVRFYDASEQPARKKCRREAPTAGADDGASGSGPVGGAPQQDGDQQGSASDADGVAEVPWLHGALPAHALVLSAHSARLKAQLHNAGWLPAKRARAEAAEAEAGAAAVERPPQQRLLAVPLEGPHELQPALEVLEWLYTGTFKSTGLLKLLEVRRLAQYLLASACIEAATAAVLAAAQPEAPALSYDDALHAFSSGELACALADPQLQPVVDKCCGTLAAVLRGTLSVARNATTLRAAWAALPLTAVEALLASPAGLRVDCEDTVLLLLHRWAERNRPADAVLAKQQHKRLRRLLRPLQLSPTYLHHVLPALDWPALTAVEGADLAVAARCYDRAVADPPSPPDNASFCWLQGTPCRSVCAGMRTFQSGQEPQWLQLRGERAPGNADATGGARAPAAAPTEQPDVLKFEWALPRSELDAMLGAARAAADARTTAGDRGNARLAVCYYPVSGSTLYLQGYCWGFQMAWAPADSTPAGESVDGAEEAAAAAAVAPHALAPVKGGLHVSCLLPEDFGLETATCSPPFDVVVRTQRRVGAAASLHTRSLLARLFNNDVAWGWGKCFSEHEALDAASWEPFVVDGCVRMAAEITFVPP